MTDEMKSIVVYYSYCGSYEEIAKVVATKQQADLLPISLLKYPQANRLRKFLLK